MKFHTHQLARGPVNLDIRCTPTEIALNDSDVQFVGEVTGYLKFTQVDHGRILAQGSVQAMMHFDCVRCLESAMMTLHGDLVAVYESTTDPPVEVNPFDDPADHALVNFNGDTLDPAPQIREAIMLAVPDYPVCRPDCQGLCPTCGGNLNLGPCRCDPKSRELPSWKAKLRKIQLDEL